MRLQAYTALLLGLSTIFFVMLVFWIRNIYGIIWVILFCALNVAVVYYLGETIACYVSLFYATVLLTEAVFSTLVQLKITLFDSRSACDASVLARLTHIPAFIWSLGFTAYSLFVAYRVYLFAF